MSKVECKCKHCKQAFMARVADRKRGWARFCSKYCKAKKQVKTMAYDKDTQRSFKSNKDKKAFLGIRGAYIEDMDYTNADWVEDKNNYGNLVTEQDYTWTKH